MDIVIATNNKDKLKEFKEILLPLGVNCLTLKDINVDVDPEEDGTTFKENSYIKATTIGKYTSLPVIADDSGIIIDALPGELGVYSKRFMEFSPYEEKNKTIIGRIKGKVRTARYVCVITLTNYMGKTMQFEGIWEGYISDEAKGTHGFGYDPIFCPLGSNKTVGEMQESEKHKISHRGIAAKKLFDFLKESIGE